MPYGSHPPPPGGGEDEALASPVNPALPTQYPPGSPGKLRVLRARARARLPLFLPGDRQGEPQPQDVTRQRTGPAPPRQLPQGVSWDRTRRRYLVRIVLVVGERPRKLGLYRTLEAAVAAIAAARKQAG